MRTAQNAVVQRTCRLLTRERITACNIDKRYARVQWARALKVQLQRHLPLARRVGLASRCSNPADRRSIRWVVADWGVWRTELWVIERITRYKAVFEAHPFANR